MMARSGWSAGVALSALAVACGSSGASLLVGSDDGGNGSFVGVDSSDAAALGAHIEHDHMTIQVVTVSCGGGCSTVEAVATGGRPPYTFVWEDGSTNRVRTVCPTSGATWVVTVTDTGSSGEVPRPPETAQASVTADVLECPDGGAADAAPDGPTDCVTLLTAVAGSGAVTGPGARDCTTEAGVPVLAAPASIQMGQEYEVTEDVSVKILLGNPPVWDFYGSSDVCYLPPGARPLGSLTQDPNRTFQSFCFTADADYAALDWTYTSVAAGVGQTTYRLCHGCSHGASR